MTEYTFICWEEYAFLSSPRGQTLLLLHMILLFPGSVFPFSSTTYLQMQHSIAKIFHGNENNPPTHLPKWHDKFMHTSHHAPTLATYNEQWSPTNHRHRRRHHYYHLPDYDNI